MVQFSDKTNKTILVWAQTFQSKPQRGYRIQLCQFIRLQKVEKERRLLTIKGAAAGRRHMIEL